MVVDNHLQIAAHSIDGHAAQVGQYVGQQAVCTLRREGVQIERLLLLFVVQVNGYHEHWRIDKYHDALVAFRQQWLRLKGFAHVGCYRDAGLCLVRLITDGLCRVSRVKDGKGDVLSAYSYE